MPNRIRELRRARHITQQEVAALLGTTSHTIGRLERDELTLTAKWMERIAGVLGVSPGDLFPQTGKASDQLVQSAEELKVLAWWRRLNRDQKFAVIEFAKRLGINPTINGYRPDSRRTNA